jgi:copper chaperone NosL
MKVRLFVLGWMIFLVAGLTAGCAQGQTEVAPPEIRYGEDVCADCNMIISDPRFAAGYAHEISPGRYLSLAFDDLGDMLASAAKHPEHKVVAWYVHDYESEEWLDATTAFYVFSENIRSPMASGATAHATRETAEAMAAEMDGEVLDWQGLRDRFDAGKLMIGMAQAEGSAKTTDHQHGMTPGHQHGAMAHVMDEGQMKEVILGEAEVNGHQLQLLSHGPLHAGYNQIMLHATTPEGAPAAGLAFAYAPIMSMRDGKNHASPVENPVEAAPGMYHGAVIFSMADGPDLGDWSLTVVMTDAASVSGETTFPVDVAPSKLIGSFVAPDESKLFVAVIQPLTPTVGVQPIELLVFRRESMMEWPVVDDLTLHIEPEMPTMGHGSPNNEEPVSVGNGHYLGKVNFTMSGPWTVTTTVSQDETSLGEVVFEFEVR